MSSSLAIVLKPTPNTSVRELIDDAILMADRLGMPVTFEVDGYSFRLTQSSNAESVFENYMAERGSGLSMKVPNPMVG